MAAQEAKRFVKAKRVILKPLNAAQEAYDKAITNASLIFGVGPAGTGKTYYAAIRAAEAFKAGEIERIIITRPAVTAEEDLGFLPGELDEKYEPYFRPVAEALTESLGAGPLEYALKAGTIEARPLAYLRGATFKNCWVIVDEAQNMTRGQMKLLLTRIGENCKVIVNGDPAQIDIDEGASGLHDAVRRLHHLAAVQAVAFSTADIVRSGLCQQVVEAYTDGSDYFEAPGFDPTALDPSRIVPQEAASIGVYRGH